MKKIIIIFSFLCLSCFAVAQETLIPKEVKAYIKARIETETNVGIAIGVIEDDKVEFFSAGKTALENGKAVDENSVFEIGSISKVFTAVLLAEKIKNNQMRLEDPISKFLPNTVKVPTRNGKKITLKDLVTHTSALPRMPDNFTPANPNNPFADYTYDQLYSFLNNYELTRDIGIQYEYSNLGMGLLGHILELQSEKTYEELMVEKIAKPLKMDDTRLVLTKAMKKRLAYGHSNNAMVENWDIITLGGAGGIRSTVTDMVTFLKANMVATKSNLLDAMQLTHETTFKDGETGRKMGLAWHIENEVFLMHSGATGGYCAMTALEKGKQKGVIVLTNSNVNVDPIAIKLMVPSYKLPIVKPSISKLIIKEIDKNGVDKAIALYKKTKSEQPEDFNFDEEQLNSVGYNYMIKDDLDNALAIFKLNVEMFPKAFNPYDSLAEAYLEKTDTVLAIKNYKKSLELNPANDNARDTLKRLGENIEVFEVSEEVLKSYVGKYQLAPSFIITITVKDGHLFAQATGQSKFEIYASEKHKFFYKVVEATIEFNINDKDEVHSLTLFQGGQVLPAKKIE